MELMFSKLAALEKDSIPPPSTNGAGGAHAGAAEEEDPEERFEMEPVAVQRFEASLGGGHWGIHAYVPVTFSGVHFVRVDCMVSFDVVCPRGVCPSLFCALCIMKAM